MITTEQQENLRQIAQDMQAVRAVVERVQALEATVADLTAALRQAGVLYLGPPAGNSRGLAKGAE